MAYRVFGHMVQFVFHDWRNRTSTTGPMCPGLTLVVPSRGTPGEGGNWRLGVPVRRGDW